MARYGLRRFGVSATEAEAIAQGLRARRTTSAPAASSGGGRPGWWASLRGRATREAEAPAESEGMTPDA